MEYYAKSSTYILSECECKELSAKTHELLEELAEELSEEDVKILNAYEKSLWSEQKAEHKTLAEHLAETVRCAEDFFDTYGDYFTDKEKTLVLTACREHDVGKVNEIFQRKVNPDLKFLKKEEEIPHGFLSALSMNKSAFLNDNPNCSKDDFYVLLTSVYFHHNRKDTYNEEYFDKYCGQYYLDRVRAYKNDREITVKGSYHKYLLFSNDKRFNYRSVPEDIWCRYMLVKGLLNKFDWTVSAGYQTAEMTTDRWEKLLCKTIETQLQSRLRPAQQFMLAHRDRNVVVTAPTGSGKTEAALLWLNGEKGFYTLPLKVSSNAIYKRIKERYHFNSVALLHSDSMSMYIEESSGNLEEGNRHYEQSKLLSYPLTVCTVDQLFKFVYKALGTEIFAATLKYSRLIIDEIQSYSPNIVAAIIYGLSELQRMGGWFAIITATFPPVLKYFMKKCMLIENSEYLYADFSDTAEAARHRIHVVDGEFDIEDMVTNARHKKVLVICNTVSRAQKLYEEIRMKCDNAGLLHSRFIRKHRDILENDILEFSNNEEAVGIWIATQIVEASLDIDFDVLYTEMCTADSLLQRMGRCNRAGKKSMKDPNIIVMNIGRISRGKVDGIYDKDIYCRSVELLRKYENSLFMETDKTAYINEVYDTVQIKNTAYFMQIEKNIKKFKELRPLEYDATDADADFRDIQSITVIPERVYCENQLFIEKMIALIKTPNLHKGVRKILRTKLESITLNVNLINGKYYPTGIDVTTIETLDIHRACLKYDFDEEKGRGLGLLLNMPEEEVYFV